MMCDSRSLSRKFLTEFISMYESYPCLWQRKSSDYKNKWKKAKAYKALIEKMREVHPNPTYDTVKRKINSLRTIYRKELRKVKKSMRSESESDIYRPSLWYFQMFHFLSDDEEIPIQWPDEDPIALDEKTQHMFTDQGSDVDDFTQAVDTDPGFSDESTPVSSHLTSAKNMLPQKRKRLSEQSEDDKTMEVMTALGNKLISLQSDDGFSVFGTHVANKLRNLPSQQNTIAQKLISDVLFEAEMGTLHRHFELVDGTLKSSHQ